jgi:hypothetical protein
MDKIRQPISKPTAKDMADFNLSRLFYAVKDALPEILRLWDKYRDRLSIQMLTKYFQDWWPLLAATTQR